MGRSAKARAKRAPIWFTDYFEAALDHSERLQNVVELSGRGINSMALLSDLLRMLERLEGEKRQEGELEGVEKMAEIARAEIDRKFSTLFGFGVLAYWSWLETLVVDFMVLWITKKPSAVQNLKAVRLKVDLTEYVRLKGRDRARFIVDCIDRELRGPSRIGMGRFETLLEAIGLRVSLNDELRRDLYEFQQVRNCLAHHFGVADKKLIAACPWLKANVGQPLAVSRSDFVRYGNAATTLLLQLLCESASALGCDVRSTVGKANEKSRAQGRRKQNDDICSQKG